MPKSRKRKTQSKGKDYGSKLRRWTFLAKITQGETTKSFNVPAFTLGDFRAAKMAAQGIRTDIAENPRFAGTQVAVASEGHETISQIVLDEFRALQKQQDLLTQVLKAAVKDVVSYEAALSATDYGTDTDLFDKAVTERLGKYVLDTQHRLRRESLVAQGIDPDQVVEPEIAIPNGYGVATDGAENQPDGHGAPETLEAAA